MTATTFVNNSILTVAASSLKVTKEWLVAKGVKFQLKQFYSKVNGNSAQFLFRSAPATVIASLNAKFNGSAPVPAVTPVVEKKAEVPAVTPRVETPVAIASYQVIRGAVYQPVNPELYLGSVPAVTPVVETVVEAPAPTPSVEEEFPYDPYYYAMMVKFLSRLTKKGRAITAKKFKLPLGKSAKEWADILAERDTEGSYTIVAKIEDYLEDNINN
jgi:hypothetical protein